MADEVDEGEESSGSARMDRRIATVTARRREAEAALTAAEERIHALEGEITTWKTQAKSWESVQAERDGLVAEREGWATEKALVGAGLTDLEGIDMARMSYARVRPEDRPKGGIGEWIKSDAVPRGVRSYLPSAEDKAAATAKAEPAKAQPRQAANTDSKARSTAGAPQTFAPGSVSGMSNAELAASQDAIWASMGMQPPNVPGVTRAAKA